MAGTLEALRKFQCARHRLQDQRRVAFGTGLHHGFGRNRGHPRRQDQGSRVSRQAEQKQASARVAPYFRGCSAQTCDLNFLSRSVSQRCFISSIDLPTTGPDALNSHAQTEQTHPWNRSRSTHTVSRAKEHLPQESVRGGRYHHARWTRSRQVVQLSPQSENVRIVQSRNVRQTVCRGLFHFWTTLLRLLWNGCSPPHKEGMERDYDLFEVPSDGAVLWRQMAAGREHALRKLAELSNQTSHEIRVMHILTNTMIASMNGPNA